MTQGEETVLRDVLRSVESLQNRLVETNAKLDIADKTISELKALQIAEVAAKARDRRSRKMAILATILVLLAFIGNNWRSNDQISCVSAWGRDLTERSINLSSPANLRVTDLYGAIGASLRGTKLSVKDRKDILTYLETQRGIYPGLPTKAILQSSTDVGLAGIYNLVLGQIQNDKYQGNLKKFPVPKLECPFWSVS